MAETTLSVRPAPRRGHPYLGHLREFLRDRHDFLMSAQDHALHYGDVVPIRVGRRPVVIVNGPERIDEVLVGRHDAFRREYFSGVSRRVIGDGLFGAHGEFGRRNRRRLLPIFYQRRIDDYALVMIDRAEAMIGSWRDGETRDLHHEMMRMTIEIAGRAFFGADIRPLTDEIEASMQAGADDFIHLLRRPLVPEWLPTPTNRRMRSLLDRLDRIVYGLIDARRAQPGGDDVLTLLLSSTDDAGCPLSDRYIRDEAVTLLLAGHETTAVALAWACHALAQQPSVQDRLQAEVDRVVGGRRPAPSDRHRLPFTRQVVQEVLRLYPPIWGLARTAEAPCEIGGHPVTPGTTVMVSQWLAHRDSRSFADPDRFDPDRWVADAPPQPAGCPYFPFSAGPRNCIGSGFAFAEMTLVLAMIAQRYRFAPSPLGEARLHPSFTLRPKEGVPLVVRRRA